MRTDDLMRVQQIEQASQTHPWTASQFADSLQRHRCTVMTDLAGRVVGFCILQPVLDEASLLLMAIDPACRQRGLGRQLLEQSLTALGEGYQMIFLEVRASNLAARRLYESTGFNVMDTRRNYYPVVGGGHEDALLMAQMRLSLP